MKIRESGMPDEGMWRGFFDAEAILTRLGLSAACRDVVDFGCGYGTFTIPAAGIVSGTVHALDIEAEMIQATKLKAQEAGLLNVKTYCHDFMIDGAGLPAASVEYAMLFNIIHTERPRVLLGEAFRVLKPSGLLAIIHWNYDPTTPRGPSLVIRPRPEQCRKWAEEAGFRLHAPGIIDLPPYHFGLVLERNGAEVVDGRG